MSLTIRTIFTWGRGYCFEQSDAPTDFEVQSRRTGNLDSGNAQRMEDASYNRENLNPQMKGADDDQTANTVAVPEGVDAELLMKVLGNPEMAVLLTNLAKSLKR